MNFKTNTMESIDKYCVIGTPKTPEIDFNRESGVMLFKGRSIPENSLDFFQPIYDWIDKYGDHPQPNTVVQIKLEYFNTSSSKCILDMLRKFETINNGKSKVRVEWYFETDDEDMEEAGEDYQAIVELPFKMIEVEEI
ncbi:MAG TPA: DUF1987 domain-containing protein [Taishania sp.]|nr:DUF1987 domain-containing protein [Taishania sp.]HNS41657.1 DUF1987 domain-containing protein [Taishania sp.]